MDKFKQIYEEGKILNKEETTLFRNISTKKDMEKIASFDKPVILYDNIEKFFNNIEFINRNILRRKIKVLSFNGKILSHINGVRKVKKITIGIYGKYVKQIEEELGCVYNLEYSEDYEKFVDYKNPLIILDYDANEKTQEILKNRKDYPTYFLSSNNPNILQNIVLNVYIDDLDICNKFRNCSISGYFSHMKYRIEKIFGVDEKNEDGYLVHFGCMTDEDFSKIMEFNGVVFLYWFGVEFNNKKIKKILKSFNRQSNIIHLCLSENSVELLHKYNIQSYYVKNDFVNNKFFTPVKQKGESILICNGYKRGYASFYNENICKKIVEEMPEYNFIFTSRLNVKYEKMSEVYAKCFIGLRLTEFDGYSCMAEEMGLMQIPIVHNFSENGLKWNTIEDVKKHIKKHSPPVIQYQHQYKIDLYNNDFNNEELELIYKNIDEFGELINPYKNILFICRGNPLKDDNAASCYNIQQFYEKNHTTIGVYLTKDRRSGGNYNLILEENVGEFLVGKQVDLVIAMGPLALNLKEMLGKPVIYLVEDLYRDGLDRYYFEKGSDRFLHNIVLRQIELADLTFVNSGHVVDILKKKRFKTKLFYWNFVKYYGKYLRNYKDWRKRKYDFGIFINNFERKIKNVDKLFEFIKEKKCLLVGANSGKYGCDSKEFVEVRKMWREYSSVKYILIDSFYESCSMQKVEGFFYGCKTAFINNVSLMEEKLELKRGQKYVISFDGVVLSGNMREGINFVEGYNDKEILIYYSCLKDEEITVKDLIKRLPVNYEVVGYNTRVLGEKEFEKLYYWYGAMRVKLEFLGLEDIFEYYEKPGRYNVDIMKRKYIYELGKNGAKLDMDNFARFVLDNEKGIITKRCLVMSKKIRGYGGCQKTALQLIKMLERHYIVDVISINIFGIDFNWAEDNLVPAIHNMKIIKKKRPEDLITHINNTNYELIINNKFDNCERIIDEVNKKSFVITHNSMDTFNKIILEKQNQFSKVLTINKFHQKVLQKHGLKIPVGQIFNFINCFEPVGYRKEMTKKICYVGRLSKEKNIQLLLEAYKQLDLGIKLVLVGDGEMEKEEMDGVEWLGKKDFKGIREVLQGCDYLVLPSYTEGIPFVLLEAMSMGIPCIYSNINGASEVVGNRGFLFNLKGYDECRYRMDWSVYDEVDKYWEENVESLVVCIKKAYSVSIGEWNRLSRLGYDFVKRKYEEEVVMKKNMSLLGVK